MQVGGPGNTASFTLLAKYFEGHFWRPGGINLPVDMQSGRQGPSVFVAQYKSALGYCGGNVKLRRIGGIVAVTWMWDPSGGVLGILAFVLLPAGT